MSLQASISIAQDVLKLAANRVGYERVNTIATQLTQAIQLQDQWRIEELTIALLKLMREVPNEPTK